jgi:hypothetical protein
MHILWWIDLLQHRRWKRDMPVLFQNHFCCKNTHFGNRKNPLPQGFCRKTQKSNLYEFNPKRAQTARFIFFIWMEMVKNFDYHRGRMVFELKKNKIGFQMVL